MKMQSDKKEMEEILREKMVALDDPNFTVNIVNRYIEQRDLEKFNLFRKNDLLYVVCCILIVLCSLIFVIMSGYTEILNGYNIQPEYLEITAITLFVFLVYRFFSEFMQVKATLAEIINPVDQRPSF